MTPRENCTTRRIRTNTPLQALVTLNDPGFIEMAAALGKRMKDEPGDFGKSKINKGFKLLLIRTASSEESSLLEKSFNDMKNSGKKEDECWTVIGNILLNLDETVNKI